MVLGGIRNCMDGSTKILLYVFITFRMLTALNVFSKRL